MKKVIAILAGGQSQRMGGPDKATVSLNDRRMVDLVIERLTPQADAILISGRNAYGAGLPLITDAPAAPAGPAAGVYSVWKWLASSDIKTAGFFTAPVDCPFPPSDLVLKLGASGAAAIAADDDGIHPTFAYWPFKALEAAFEDLSDHQSISLKSLAGACDAAEVSWSGGEGFININTPEELHAAARRHS